MWLWGGASQLSSRGGERVALLISVSVPLIVCGTASNRQIWTDLVRIRHLLPFGGGLLACSLARRFLRPTLGKPPRRPRISQRLVCEGALLLLDRPERRVGYRSQLPKSYSSGVPGFSRCAKRPARCLFPKCVCWLDVGCARWLAARTLVGPSDLDINPTTGARVLIILSTQGRPLTALRVGVSDHRVLASIGMSVHRGPSGHRGPGRVVKTRVLGQPTTASLAGLGSGYVPRSIRPPETLLGGESAVCVGSLVGSDLQSRFLRALSGVV